VLDLCCLENVRVQQR